MLVLARKIGQSIHIGDGITLTITQVKGNTVRLGISAPAEVAIRRGELKPHDDARSVSRLANPVAPLTNVVDFHRVPNSDSDCLS